MFVLHQLFTSEKKNAEYNIIMNLDNKKLEKWLKQLVDCRNYNLKESEEFNILSEEEFNDYLKETDEIKNLIKEISQNNLNNDELSNLKNQYAYLKADFENYKKRQENQKLLSYSKIKSEIISHFLSVYDNIERLCEQIINYRNKEDDEITSFIHGCHLIFKQIKEILSDLNVHQIEISNGSKFDVSCMNAISSREDENFESDYVLEVVRSGWTCDNKVLRYANVIVSV